MKAKQWRRLIFIAVLIGLLWGGAIWARSNAAAEVRAANKTRSGEAKQPEPGLFNLGLDLQGGIAVVLAPKEGEPFDSESLDQAIEIIRNRVDALGVAEPDITRQGNNVLVQLPGLRDQERALQAIGTTARLRFRPVEGSLGPAAQQPAEPPKDLKVPTCGNRDTYPRDVPTQRVVLCVRPEVPTDQPLPPGDQWDRLILAPAELQGDDVSGASAALDQNGQWTVNLNLNREGSRKFAEVSKRLAKQPVGDPKRQLAIVLDGEVRSHPQIGEDVDPEVGLNTGSATISGQFTEEDARDLALVLKYGSLPVELEPSTTTTVSPTLGRDSLRSGLLAALIGLGVVILYVSLFYRALAPLIWIGLIIHAAITAAAVSLLGQVAGFALSLAGIAGMIVSLGVATDSFIVYFERIKDEVAGGRPVRGAVDRAWLSARRTIVAADIVTALAAVTLYFLAVGNVRGFALMLGLSTALDLFVSYLFMHPAVWLLAQTRVLGRSKTLGARRVATAGGRA